MGHIDLRRRFQRLTALEREDADFLLSMAELPLPGHMGWEELLEHERVMLLAEGGAGKTVEMCAQKSRLVADDRFAFFVELEELDRQSLLDILGPQETSKFVDWKADGEDTAWFFLDAMDELKLTGGKLDRALRRLANDIDGGLVRARFILSCRPNDWRPGRDLDIVKKNLPAPPQPDELGVDYGDAIEDFEEHFLTLDAGAMGPTDDIVTVALLPLNEVQIGEFAAYCGVENVVGFLAEIRRENAWSFAGRPLDLQDLARVWQRSGTIGTRTEQLQLNIETKLEDPDREDASGLSDAEAIDGAGRLALGLALTRTRTIQSHRADVAHGEPAQSVLSAKSVLPDWSDSKRQALLRRALFDPATHGRVRFHHSSVQEYLAARCLHQLRGKGMSTAAVSRLLFAERYGVRIAFPSMLSITAWLADADPSVRAELLAREPEALLSHGDPATLDDAIRTSVVRRLATNYGSQGFDGLAVPIEQIRRFANPSLGSAIRDAWESGNASRDIRELFLKMIWLGPIPLCSDLAHAVAINAESTDHERIIAVRALLECGCTHVVHELSADMVLQPRSWPARVVHGVAGDLFPTVLDANQLVSLMAVTPEPENSVAGFAWAGCEIARTVDALSETAVALRNRLAELVRGGLRDAIGPEFVEGDFNYLAPALAILCKRQLELSHGRVDILLVPAAVVASRFGDGSLDSDRIRDLRACFDTDEALRRAAFRAEIEFVIDIAPDEPEWLRASFATTGESVLGTIVDSDRRWLTEELESGRPLPFRVAALHGLLDLWSRGGSSADALSRLRLLADGQPDLLDILEDASTPPDPDEAVRQHEAVRQRERDRREAQEAEQAAAWSDWQMRVSENPSVAFSETLRRDTLSGLYDWLSTRHRHDRRLAVWDKQALARAFSPSLADLAEREFRALWRNAPPPSPDSDDHLTPWHWAFLGLQSESEDPGWADRLTAREARTAAAYSTAGLGEFAPFHEDLLRSQPDAVEEVIGKQIGAELHPTHAARYPRVLGLVCHGPTELKRLLAPRLLQQLTFWRPAERDPSEYFGTHLSKLLDVLRDARVADEAVADICVNRYRDDTTDPLSHIWLKALFRLDVVRGAEELLATFADRCGLDVEHQAQTVFAAVFDDTSEEPRRLVQDLVCQPDGLAILAKLVRCSRELVRPSEDRPRTGIFTPDERFRAERARDFLLYSALLGTSGRDAYDVVLDLAVRPMFATVAGRLRLAARRRAAVDAEFLPYGREVVVDLHARFEAPPRDSDGLLRTLIDRLEDFDHDLRHHDFSVRETLQRIPSEPEMQKVLAGRLHERSNGAYIVVREDEVVDYKKPDIRLATLETNQKVVAEVKIADKWTVAGLRKALLRQLRSQYLRHASCRAGCLLLTYHGEKRYWVFAETGARLAFPDLVALLRDDAAALADGDSEPIQLTVFGLDLACHGSDPSIRVPGPVGSQSRQTG